MTPSPDPRAGSAGPIVGREAEQAVLETALASARAGQGGTVLIAGEAGIGKTTLVEWTAAESEANGALVLRGHAYDLSITPPYGPWLEIVRRYQATGRQPPAPAFVVDPTALTALGSQARLFAELTDFFCAVADSQPLVLVLEDLHWSDPASLDLLRHLARELPEHPLLILATYRNDEVDRHHPLYQLLPQLVREAHPERMDLRPLSDEAQHALVAARYALPAGERARLEHYLDERAEGNPFYAGELLRTLEAERVLIRQGDRWQLGNLDQVRVPRLLRQVIEGRLAHLGDEARGLLQLAAVIGHEVPLRLWQQVSGAPDDVLITTIEHGLAAHIIEEDRGGTRYRFRHALFRQALYEEVVALRRQGWHRQIAEALIQTSTLEPDIVAYHLQQALDQRAVDWLIKAGERAFHAYAWWTASERFEAALSLMTEANSTAEERVLLLIRIARSRRYVEPHQSLCFLVEALQAAGQDMLLRGYTLFEVGMLQAYNFEIRDGLASMKEGVAILDALSPLERARVDELGLEIEPDNNRSTLAGFLAMAGHFEEAITLAQRALTDHAESFTSNLGGSGMGDAWIAIAESAAVLGGPNEARTAFERATSAFESAGHYIQACWSAAGELNQFALTYRPDDLDLRQQLAQLSEDAALRARDTLPGLPPHHALLPFLFLEGRWAEIDHLAPALQAYPNPGAVTLFLAHVFGPLARLRGDGDTAWGVVRQLLPAGSDTGPGNQPFTVTLPLQRLAGELALDAGDLPKARSWLEAHDRWLDWSGAVIGRAEGALLWAQFHHSSGDVKQASLAANEALRQASEPRQPLALISIHRFLGELDIEAHRMESAEEQLRQSLTLAEACAAPFERALTQLSLAELRVAQRRFDQARGLLDDVTGVCSRLGAAPTVARAESLAARMKAGSSRGLSNPAGLSLREVEVLRLVAEGLTDAQVAEQLFIGPRTVSSHLRSI